MKYLDKSFISESMNEKLQSEYDAISKTLLKESKTFKVLDVQSEKFIDETFSDKQEAITWISENTTDDNAFSLVEE